MKLVFFSSEVEPLHTLNILFSTYMLVCDVKHTRTHVQYVQHVVLS